MGSMSTLTSTLESSLICMHFERHVWGFTDDAADVHSAWSGINTAYTKHMLYDLLFKNTTKNKNTGQVYIIYSSVYVFLCKG